jgi:hypothetical protein
VAVPKEHSLDPVTARLLERHKDDIEAAERALGDHPLEAFAHFVREHYDYDLLNKVYREMLEGESDWLDDGLDES